MKRNGGEKMKKIMLVDDEESICKVVEHIVKRDGYEFCYAKNGYEALDMFEEENPDLIILDVMMPELDGFAVCESIRAKSDVPIIFVSAKGDIVDKSVGFKMGADDYLVKPFSSVELALRIKALLRRSNLDKSNKNENNSDYLKVNDLEIYYKKYEVYSHGKKVDLTSKEFEILALLARNKGHVFTREQLLESIWGESYIGDVNTITIFVRKIREKIEDNPSKPKYLLTVWGVGYKFCN